MFCQFIRDRESMIQILIEQIWFIGGAYFTRSGICSLHNEHVFVDRNLHAIKVAYLLILIDVWAGIADRYIIGPVVIIDRLDRNIYLHFCKTYSLLL